MHLQKENFRTMAIVLFTSTLIMGAKFLAWFYTNSVTILSDALESIIHIVTQSFALYTILYVSKPKDRNHPYGHGKMESFSVGLEGGLVLLAGMVIFGKSIYQIFQPSQIGNLDFGILLTGLASAINFLLAKWLIKVGNRNNSAPLIADGKHILTDFISSAFMILGLIIMFFTKWYWLDVLMGLLSGALILRIGYKLFKQALSNLLDEADEKNLLQVAEILNNHRQPNWIDIHKLRIQKFGDAFHIDAHITLPFYMPVDKAHDEVSQLEHVLVENLSNSTEMFLHIDPCKPSSCAICCVNSCAFRSEAMKTKIEWDLNYLLPNKKHGLLSEVDR